MSTLEKLQRELETLRLQVELRDLRKQVAAKQEEARLAKELESLRAAVEAKRARVEAVEKTVRRLPSDDPGIQLSLATTRVCVAYHKLRKVRARIQKNGRHHPDRKSNKALKDSIKAEISRDQALIKRLSALLPEVLQTAMKELLDSEYQASFLE